MRLSRLRLVNFRQHRDTEIEFGPGLTGIIGPNGAGKSTLLEAVAWALYGMDAARGSRDGVRWRRARPRAEVKVELEFGLGPHEYRVVRTLFNAELFLDHQPRAITTSLSEVTARLSRVLGMTLEEFRNTFFTGQRELAAMAALKPVERRRFLNRLLGYEKLQRAQQLVRDRKNAMSGELTGLVALTPDPAALAAERERRAALVEEAGRRLTAAEDVLAAAKAASDQHLPVFRELREFRERHVALTAERRLAEERLRQTVELIARLERELAEAAATADERARQAAELERRIAAARAAAGQVRAMVEALEAARGELETVEREAEEQRSAWVREKADADATRRSLRDQFRDLKAQKERVVAAGEGGACPTCGRRLGAEYGAVLELLDSQLEAITQNGQYYTQRIEQLQRPPADLAALGERRQQVAQQVEQLAQELALARRAADEAVALDRQRQRLLAEAERTPRLEAERQAAQRERADRVEALAAVQRDLDALEFNEEAFLAAEREMERLERAWQDAERDVAVARAELGAERDRLREAERREQEAAARAARAAELRGAVRLHTELDRALGDLGTELNAEIGPEIAALAGEFLAVLTDGQYDEIILDDEFNATVLQDGEPQGVISGGEEDLRDLVLRLAVSQMIADRAGHPLTLLVLDEIFGALDEGHRSHVVRLLRGLEARFPQVILITHIEGVRDSLDRVLRVRYDEAAGSAVVTEERGLPVLPGGADAHVAA